MLIHFFLVKIIDYGRSYYEKSERIIQDLCDNVRELQRTRLCDPTSRIDYNLSGYEYAVGNPKNPLEIVSVKNNKSADLRLLYILFKYREYLDNLQYTNGLDEFIGKLNFNGRYNTLQQQDSYYRYDHISTVSDAFHMLRDLVVRNRNNGYYDMRNKRNREKIKLDIDFNDINFPDEEYWK